jgi:hypothetical protein
MQPFIGRRAIAMRRPMGPHPKISVRFSGQAERTEERPEVIAARGPTDRQLVEDFRDKKNP